MGAILSFILGLVDPVGKIVDAIVAAKNDAANAQNEADKIAADERVKTLEARRDVLVAEAGVSRLNIIMRLVLAAPVAVVLWKILVWDKALGQWTGGSTDSLSPELWQVVMAVLGFYFLYEGAVGVARILKQ